MSWGTTDPAFQEYAAKKDKTRRRLPRITFGGPIWKDRIFGFIGFNPNSMTRAPV